MCISKWKENYDYGNEVKYILNTCKNENFEKLAQIINEDATIALSSFNFLLNQIVSAKGIAVISNKDWLHKSNNDNIQVLGGEQPIDVAFTI